MRGEKRKRTLHMGDGIHPRNKYNQPPDFKALGEDYPALQLYLTSLGNGQVNLKWNEPSALRELTTALLHRDFNLNWTMPDDRLCPTLTNRLNYVHWIEDLILLSQSNYTSSNDHPISGIDIGTGASCIYPLLGHQLNQWHFIATDIDPISIEYAKKNVIANHLENAIQILHVKPDTIFPQDIPTNCLFSMCNPPFFDTMEEADRNPRADCTGSLNEMTTPGGEVEFIKKMINASLHLKTEGIKVRWYTSLIGRKSSLRPLLAALRSAGIHNMRTTEFLQGRTTRWGIAWSFTQDGLDAQDKSSYKVLAKRKEAKRRQRMEFVVSHLSSEQDGNTIAGCSSLDHVKARITESPSFLSALGTLNITNSSNTISLEFTSAKALEKWTGIVQIYEKDEGFQVSLEWKSGKRDLFWIIADKWKATIMLMVLSLKWILTFLINWLVIKSVVTSHKSTMSSRITKQILRSTVVIDEPKETAKKPKNKKQTKPIKKRRRFLEEARLERTKADNTSKNVKVLQKLTKTPQAQDLMKKILQQTQRM
ncbi:methyltransferase METT10D [Thraustotheca clavata]|uniref:Methyltransferase METT10D n=1 Tax=Thraustotheca clavata TaxID=74557 RepID=A0A1V9ZQJ8_9STRA|nr:methyltransferase METT10D [Thraustotheca clavata]